MDKERFVSPNRLNGWSLKMYLARPENEADPSTDNLFNLFSPKNVDVNIGNEIINVTNFNSGWLSPS